MFRKRTRDLVNLSQQAAQMDKTELSSSRESSPAPSLPPELHQLLEDSDEYFPEGSSSSDNDSSQDIQWKVKRRKRCTGMDVLTTSNEVSLQSQSTTTSTTQSQKPSSFATDEDIPILPDTSEDRQQSIGDDTSPATPVLDTPNSPSTSQHVRKSESRMIRKQRKINRNTGKAYQDSKGKEVRGRTCRRLENCRMKCGERFSYCDRNDIFNSYWALGDHLCVFRTLPV
ncbi:uncharacterized protein LOC120354334 [Nilaparvata lugens]|uniref:uncharacterized protein LOC120354334 n=1 Tax=Nilaparvata lugens TaxID=108931 RepID=UPI00193E90E7|nr:uncharacterized protein LOC120354334 [Nilaparvata lugens]